MRFTFGQEQRQEQKQILTQRMIQSMEILQLTNLQLEERIDQELEKNPVLELDTDSQDRDDSDRETGSDYEEQIDSDEPSESDGGDDDAGSERSFEVEPEISFDSSPNSREEFQIADDFAQNYADTIDEAPARSQNWLEDAEERRNNALASIPSRSETLQDHLMAQLGWFDLSMSVRVMCEKIINNLDRNGYFTIGLDELLDPKATAEDRLRAENSLVIVRKLDPAGVGAKNLKDCLFLQLTPDMLHVDVVRLLIAEHLEDIRNNRLPQIVKATGYPISVIQEAIAVLRHLNPRPGAEFAEQAAPAIIPDIFVEKNDKGHYVVRLEDGRSEHLHVSRYYRDLAKDRGVDKGTREFIKQRVGSAQWLIEAILQRRETLLKVSQAIVDHQVDFFEIGPQAIKPLKMQQIADQVNVHITTVSRAVDEKWMITPQGIYPLKRFFSGAIARSDGGEEMAQDAVRLKLREIIDKEDKSSPFSDDAIVKKLDEAGIKVARRTVVKYRDAMNIPNSRERKDWGDS